jgi:hypothetical protein
VFRCAWSFISKFVDERTRRKVHVVQQPDELLQTFDARQLPAEYRGLNTAEAHQQRPKQ